MTERPKVTVRYWAAAKEAAGRAEEQVEAATVAEALAAVLATHADRPRLADVLRRCSVLVDGDPVGQRRPERVPLREHATVELLPPYAGG